LYVLAGYYIRIFHKGPAQIIDENGIENNLSGCEPILWKDLITPPLLIKGRNPSLEITVRSPQAYLEKMPEYKKFLKGIGFYPFKFYLVFYDIEVSNVEAYLQKLRQNGILQN